MTTLKITIHAVKTYSNEEISEFLNAPNSEKNERIRQMKEDTKRIIKREMDSPETIEITIDVEGETHVSENQ